MKPTDAIEHLLKRLKYRATPEFRLSARERMLSELERARAAHEIKPQPLPLWRIIMSSRTTYYAGAVSVLVALALVVLPLGGPLDNHGVVWADVVKKTEAVDTLTYREKRLVYKLGEEALLHEFNVFKKASSKFGIVEKQYDSKGELTHVAYFLKKDKRMLVVFPRNKRYLEVPLSDEGVALMDDFSPKGMVKLLTRHGYKKLEPTELDGRKVEGFQMSQKQVQDVLDIYNYKKYGFIFPAKEITLRLWVDVESSLPVRAECDFTTGRGLLTGFKKLRCRFKAYDIQWDVKIDPEDFVPNIPDDYKPIDLKSLDVQPSQSKEKTSDEPAH